jgi:hypothetical protein
MQALPPKHLYSATVVNLTDGDVKAVVTYSFHTGESEDETATVASQGSHTFEQRLITEGSARFTGQVAAITVTRGNASAKIEAPFEGVHGPVKHAHVAVKGSGDSIEIAFA